MKRHLKINLFLSSAIIFFLSTVLFAQGRYSIKGIVKDTAGIGLPGVNVNLIETNYGAATGLNGNFEINNLRPGRYTLQFSSIGFSSKTISGIILKDKSVELNIVLRQTAIESKQVVVTASKYAQKISELPVSASVLSSNTLAETNINNLQDAMSFVPGVNMVDDQISIRGSSGYSRGAGTRVLLEIDGVPYYTGDTGEIIWEILPVSEIDRVEVIKGAASSLYGSSAIGGVINVITKKIDEKPVNYAKVYAGFYGKPSYSIWDWSGKTRTFNGLTLARSQRTGKFGYSIALTGLADMGFKQSGFFKRYIGYFKGRYNFSPSSSLTFFTNSLYQNSGTFLYWKNSRNALVPPDADQGERTTSFRSMYAVVYKSVLSRDLFLNVNSAYYRTDWKDQTSSMNHSLANLYRTEIQTGYNISPDIMLVSGIAGSISGVSSNIFGDPGAFGFGVYSQADVNFGKNFLLSAGVRYDYNKLDSLGGSNAVSPKLGVNYKVSENLTLRSSLGTGFRSPTLAEAFTSTTASGITIEPNPDLKPEHNFNVEVGANYQLNSFINLDLALFQNEFYDFIEPGVNPADGRFFFGNITRARIRGIEFETEAGLLNDRLQLSADYTYLWARDLQKGTQLKYRPLNNVTLRADYKFGIFSAGADFRYHSKVEQMDFELVDLGVVRDGRLRVPVYVLNLRAGCDFREFGIPGRAYLNANNVLNYNYVELMANIAPIRNFSLSLEFLF